MNELVARLRAAGCVFAEDEARILTEAADGDAARLDELVTARVGGLPLEHLVGWAELDGRRWLVAPGVFVPRQRSELLVREASARATAGTPEHPFLLVDLCCGCGALGGAVAARLLAAGHDVELHAADVDPVAVTCAHDNLKALAEEFAAPGATHPGDGGHAVRAGRLTAHTSTGDLAEPLPAGVWGRVDVLVANAPYVPTGSIALMPPEARDHEPQVALDGGPDGLDVQRRVIAAAPRWLAPGGSLLIETSERQALSTAAAMADAGLTPRVERSDELDATAVVGTRA